MKISTAIAILVTSVALTACATSSNVASDAEVMKPAMKDAKMMDGDHAMKDAKMMKDTKMMKGDSCHNHAANSMTKSASHCHKSSQANHSHKYGG